MITVLLHTPKTNIEIIFITWIMLLNTGVFGYSINVLGELINDIGRN